MNRIERPNITTWDRPEPPDWRSGCVTIVLAVSIAFLLGIIVGVNAVPRAAPTTAPTTGPTGSDDRQALRMTLSPTVSVVSASPSASSAPTEAPYSSRPQPTQTVRKQTVAPEVGPMVAGVASHMGSTQGPGYLALPEGPGQHVIICGRDTGICITRTSTDAGPDLAMQRAGRVADLYRGDFYQVCGVAADEPDPGLCPVTVEYLR